MTGRPDRRQLKQGAELKPDGVAYDGLAVLLLDVVKRRDQVLRAVVLQAAANRQHAGAPLVPEFEAAL